MSEEHNPHYSGFDENDPKGESLNVRTYKWVLIIQIMDSEQIATRGTFSDNQWWNSDYSDTCSIKPSRNMVHNLLGISTVLLILKKCQQTQV